MREKIEQMLEVSHFEEQVDQMVDIHAKLFSVEEMTRFREGMDKGRDEIHNMVVDELVGALTEEEVDALIRFHMDPLMQRVTAKIVPIWERIQTKSTDILTPIFQQMAAEDQSDDNA